MKGIDVSRYQGAIDFDKVKKSGIEFVMVRAVSSNKNGLYVDPYFHSNVQNARRAGLHVGAYIYTYATTTSAVEKEINFLLDALKHHEFDMPIAFDMEYEPSILALSKSKRTDICVRAMEMIEDAGYYAMMYASKDFYQNLLDTKRLAAYAVWIAQYAQKCTSKVSPGLWQYTSKGSVAGINGNVDMDVAYRDFPKIIAGMGKASEKPIPIYTLSVSPMTIGDINQFTALADKLNIPYTFKEV